MCTLALLSEKDIFKFDHSEKSKNFRVASHLAHRELGNPLSWQISLAEYSLDGYSSMQLDLQPRQEKSEINKDIFANPPKAVI